MNTGASGSLDTKEEQESVTEAPVSGLTEMENAAVEVRRGVRRT